MRQNVVQAWWDDQDSENTGWYWECRMDGVLICDSEKLWAPVNTRQYARDDREQLEEALKAAYPLHEVEIR